MDGSCGTAGTSRLPSRKVPVDPAHPRDSSGRPLWEEPVPATLSGRDLRQSSRRRGSLLPGKDPGMAELPADLLLAGLAAGRDEAFAALYARDGAALFRVAVALLGSRA